MHKNRNIDSEGDPDYAKFNRLGPAYDAFQAEPYRKPYLRMIDFVLALANGD